MLKHEVVERALKPFCSGEVRAPGRQGDEQRESGGGGGIRSMRTLLWHPDKAGGAHLLFLETSLSWPHRRGGAGGWGEALSSREPQAQILNLKQFSRLCFSQTQTGAHQLQAVSSPQAGLEPNSPAKHQQTVLILPATKLLVPNHQLVGYNASGLQTKIPV